MQPAAQSPSTPDGRSAETHGSCEAAKHLPAEAASNDAEVLRAALIREAIEHRRAECRASMQAHVVNLALELLVREPDIEGFFGALAKTMVEESDSYTCAVWLIDEPGQRCNLWMAYVGDRLVTARKGEADARAWPLISSNTLPGGLRRRSTNSTILGSPSRFERSGARRAAGPPSRRRFFSARARSAG
jgi:hypothetical protein